jgi:hypothetical protein
MIDDFTLKQHSTLDLNLATVRITQMYRRPSLEVQFAPDKSQEWYVNFLEKYHKTGLRYEQRSYSPDKLVLTKQIFWLNEEEWEKASTQDPFAVENMERTMKWCSEYGITNTRIREVKKDGKWWASLTTQVGQQWEYASIGNLMVNQVLLPGQKQVLLPNIKGTE